MVHKKYYSTNLKFTNSYKGVFVKPPKSIGYLEVIGDSRDNLYVLIHLLGLQKCNTCKSMVHHNISVVLSRGKIHDVFRVLEFLTLKQDKKFDLSNTGTPNFITTVPGLQEYLFRKRKEQQLKKFDDIIIKDDERY